MVDNVYGCRGIGSHFKYWPRSFAGPVPVLAWFLGEREGITRLYPAGTLRTMAEPGRWRSAPRLSNLQ